MPARITAALLLPLLALAWAVAAEAHEVRPGYLRIIEVDQETYEVIFRVPARGELRLGIYARMPAACTMQGEMRQWQQAAAYVDRWTSVCPGGLAGQDITIDGLASMLTDVLARFERLNGTTQIVRVTPSADSFTVTDAERWSEVAVTYSGLGVEHILFGIDHLLFVLALLMIVADTRTLVMTITAFTVAHSITLVAATLGWVHVPQAPVEAVIALSILFVAAEIIHWRQDRAGITRRKPWLVAFTFGLLHGFGFAGALSQIGLPEHAIPLSLLFFNVGVELGQLLFIGAVLAGAMVVRRVAWPEWAWRLPAYAIGTMAAFWTIERIAGF